MANVICLRKMSGGFWRAFLADADHCGGCGESPAEAIGFLILNHPQRAGVGEFRWLSPAPKTPGHPAEVHPSGVQEPFPSRDEGGVRS